MIFQLKGNRFTILPSVGETKIYKNGDILHVPEEYAEMIHVAWCAGHMSAHDEDKEARKQAHEYSWIKNPETMGQ